MCGYGSKQLAGNRSGLLQVHETAANACESNTDGDTADVLYAVCETFHNTSSDESR